MGLRKNILWRILNPHMVDIDARIILVERLFSVSEEELENGLGDQILRRLRRLEEESEDDFSSLSSLDDETAIINCEPDYMLELR